MKNNIGKILIISGLFMNTIISWWLAYEWLDMIGFGMILSGLFISKKDIAAIHDRIGIYIYYMLMALVIAFIYFKWFL
ncbi:MAG: hypothetical protein IPL08_18220 [Saprospiraceae bacterium]|nr:hypothetical protein [Saprospiraceae bacterium]MBK8668307.1 hypothetical protein [Saprospiraceae bacterium]